MKPNNYLVSEFLQPGQHACYQIPPFQRNYVWGTGLIHQFVLDIYEAWTDSRSHWIGITLVAMSEVKCGSKKLGHVCYEILDGQQRLITSRIWILALIDEYRRQTGFDPESLDRDEISRIDVHSLDAADWEKLGRRSISNSSALPKKEKLLSAYWYFRYMLLRGTESFSQDEAVRVPDSRNGRDILEYWLESESCQPFSPGELEELIEASLTKVMLTCLIHEEQDGSVEGIFQSLNGHREALGQYDLVRNYLMIESKFRAKEQRSFYSSSLKFGEELIQKLKIDKRKPNLDEFLYDYLISQGSISILGSVSTKNAEKQFVSYFSFVRASDDGLTIQRFVDDFFAPTMCIWAAIASGANQVQFGKFSMDIPVNAARRVRRIETLSRGPITPLLTSLLLKWMKSPGDRGDDDLEQDLKLVETRVVRDLLAGVPLSPLRSSVMKLCGHIAQGKNEALKEWAEAAEDDYKLRRVLTQSCSYQSDGGQVEPEPQDWLFAKEVVERINSPKKIRAIFDGIVCHTEGYDYTAELMPALGSRDRAKQISIEHVYPQDSQNWIEDLRLWKIDPIVMDRRLHALGNIAILPLASNIRLSNKSFFDKKRLLADQAIPNWKVNESIRSTDRWTPLEIDTRTKELTRLILEAWPLPAK